MKDEFVNVGVVMLEPGANGEGFADVRFTHDWRRVRCLDPQADVEMLEAWSATSRASERGGQPRGAAAETQRLVFQSDTGFTDQGLPGAGTGEGDRDAGQSVFRRTEAGDAGWGFRTATNSARHAKRLRTVRSMDVSDEGDPAAPYTRPGDPFKFDFGYRVGAEIKLFHAVSLKTSVEQAIMLAARYPKIARGMAQTAQTNPSLTAVVDDDLDRRRDEVRFAMSGLEEENIQVASISEMPLIAERARLELKPKSFWVGQFFAGEGARATHSRPNHEHYRKVARRHAPDYRGVSGRGCGGQAADSALAFILNTYGPRPDAYPKPSPANLRRFSETPVARKAINTIKDSIAGMRWRIQPRPGRNLVNTDVKSRAHILSENFDAPNPDDSFRSLAEQVLEDVIVGGFGAIELENTGDPLRPLTLWPVDGASIRIKGDWDGLPGSPRYAQITGRPGPEGQIALSDDELIYIRLNPRTHTPFGLGRLEVAFETINAFLGANRYAARLASNSVVEYALWLQGLSAEHHERLIRWWQDEIEGTGRVPILSVENKPEVLRFGGGTDADLRLQWQEFLLRIIADAFIFLRRLSDWKKM